MQKASKHLPVPNCSLSLRASAPDILEETITLGQSVDRVVRFAHGTNEPAESVCDVLASIAAVFVDFAHRNLNRGVIFGLDDTVGCRALARDIAATGQLYTRWS
jgi:hypothetical protein